MFNIEPCSMDVLRPRITVIGVGGAGGNAVARMIAGNAPGIDFILANTDAQALNGSASGLRIQLGRAITEGLGAGSHAAVGKAAAMESANEIAAAIDGAHMCFIAAGMGGGTGTGAAPVIAKIARDKGILTIAVVTTPFGFEGDRRARAAQSGIDALQEHVDTLIVIPNQNLFRIANPNTTFKQAFEMADEVLQQGVRGITDLMVMPGLVNLDFADVRSVMRAMGKAMMGSGEASGDDRAMVAAQLAISNPLLDGAVRGARGMIISIIGGEDMKLTEIDAAATHIKDLIDPEADIIWGSAIDPAFEGRMRVSIVATGLDLEGKPHVAALPFPGLSTSTGTGLAECSITPAIDVACQELELELELTTPLPEPASVEQSAGSFEESLGDDASPHHGEPVIAAPPAIVSPIPELLEAFALSAAPARPKPAASLFERITQLVHSPANGGPSRALLSATSHLETPGVYDRRGRFIRGPDSATARLVGVQFSNGLPAGKMRTA